MNRRLVIVTAVVLIGFAKAQTDSVPGVRLVNTTRAFTPGDCANGATTVCSTCSTFSVCVGGSSVGDFSCTGSFPYCNAGDVVASCSATATDGCGPTTGQTSMTCPSVGVLPDPSNCNQYHVCLAVGDPSDLYLCPPGTSFNLAVLQCRAQSVSPCVTVACGTTSGFVYYGNSRQYYAYCAVAAGVTTPYMFKCPNRALFSMDTKACVYSCPGQGNFVNTNDPATYYQCYVANGRWVANLTRCPAGTVFNQTLTYCTN